MWLKGRCVLLDLVQAAVHEAWLVLVQSRTAGTTTLKGAMQCALGRLLIAAAATKALLCKRLLAVEHHRHLVKLISYLSSIEPVETLHILIPNPAAAAAAAAAAQALCQAQAPSEPRGCCCHLPTESHLEPGVMLHMS
jgi:hypothetical protein